MEKGLVTIATLSDIAVAIRQKNGLATEYKPGEMAQAIVRLPSDVINIGSGAIVQDKTLILTAISEQNN